MDARLFARSVLLVSEKNMRIYYYKGAVVIFGLLFPFIMFLTFFIGRNLDLILFFPAFLGMMLFFSSSSTGPLITPWEKREKTYERLLSLPVTLESIILGDILAGSIFGIVITTIVWGAGSLILHLPLVNPGLLAVTLLLGAFTFAALGTLLSSPAMNNPSNVMMVSNLIRLPLIFISGIFIPLSHWGTGNGCSRRSPRSLISLTCSTARSTVMRCTLRSLTSPSSLSSSFSSSLVQN